MGLILDSLLTSLCAGNIDANDETSSLDAVVEEIDRCAVSAAKQGGVPRLVLCTGEGELGAQLRERVPSAIDLFEGIDSRLKLPQAVGRIPPAAAGSMLESLWPQAKGFNLLQKGRREKAKLPVAFTLFLAVLAPGPGDSLHRRSASDRGEEARGDRPSCGGDTPGSQESGDIEKRG